MIFDTQAWASRIVPLGTGEPTTLPEISGSNALAKLSETLEE